MTSRYQRWQWAFVASGWLMFATTAAASGINLAWDDCGTHGVLNKTFACTSNTGTPFRLIASFVPPENIQQFVGLSAQMDVGSFTTTLPDWWKHGSNACRGTGALVPSMDFIEGPYSCIDPFVGRAFMGFVYDVGFGSPNRARLRLQGAVPPEDAAPLDPNEEYYAFKVTINRTRSTGPGSCSGCCTRVDIFLNEIQLYQPPEAQNDPTLMNPQDWNQATWQVGTPSCEATPIQGRTWGQVKSLYR